MVGFALEINDIVSLSSPLCGTSPVQRVVTVKYQDWAEVENITTIEAHDN